MSVSVHDVAGYLLMIENNHSGKGFTPMQLHKLCFIADLLHLRATQKPLFHEYYVHTKTGPQYNELIPHHRNLAWVFRWLEGDPNNLSYGQKMFLEEIWNQFSYVQGMALAEFTLNQFEYQETDITRK